MRAWHRVEDDGHVEKPVRLQRALHRGCQCEIEFLTGIAERLERACADQLDDEAAGFGASVVGEYDRKRLAFGERRLLD
jgi:hypothetical protein